MTQRKPVVVDLTLDDDDDQVIESSSTLAKRSHPVDDDVQVISVGPSSSNSSTLDRSSSGSVQFIAKRPRLSLISQSIEPSSSSSTNRSLSGTLHISVGLHDLTSSSNNVIDLSRPINRLNALQPSQAALEAAAKLREEESKEPVAALKCAICLSLAAEDTPLSATLCGHIFCQDCLDAALARVRKCPICRKAVAKKGVHRLYL